MHSKPRNISAYNKLLKNNKHQNSNRNRLKCMKTGFTKWVT